MSYLLSQIWLCLLLTALVAGLAGWLLRGGCKGKIRILEDEWKTRVTNTENECDYYEEEVKKLNGRIQERNTQQQGLLAEKADLEKKLQEMEDSAKTASQKLYDSEQQLAVKAQELDSVNSSMTSKMEEEHQVFTQRLSEAEAGAKLAEENLSQYRAKLNSLEAELHDTRMRLEETTNRLADTETQLADANNRLANIPADSGGSSGIGAGTVASMTAAALGGAAAMASTSTADSPGTTKAADSTVDAGEEFIPEAEPVMPYHTADDELQSQMQTREVDEQGETRSVKDYLKPSALAGMAKNGLHKAKEGIATATDELLHRSDPSLSDYSLASIESISDDDASKLNQMGIKTTSDLLEKGANREGIHELAQSLGKEDWVVRSWVSAADLMRINGVNGYSAELLELSGVATVQNLERLNADKLEESVSVIHRHVGKDSAAPTVADITSWIANASELEPLLDSNIDKV